MRAMRPVSTAKELIRDPIGHYLTGGSFVLWVQRADRVGAFHQATTLDRADQPALVESFELATSDQLAPRYDVLHDLAPVTQFDESGFAFLNAFFATHDRAIQERVRRLAIVRPSGVAGAAILGLFQHRVATRFPARLCTTRAEAYDFLEVSTDDRRVLDSLSADYMPLLRQLRDHLTVHVLDATLRHAADDLGVSVRSLQRVLRDAGTSFRDELAFVRIHLAENRLLESDDKIDAIASDLGFGSSPAFIRMFKLTTGIAPGEFRLRGRTPRRGL